MAHSDSKYPVAMAKVAGWDTDQNGSKRSCVLNPGRWKTYSPGALTSFHVKYAVAIHTRATAAVTAATVGSREFKSFHCDGGRSTCSPIASIPQSVQMTTRTMRGTARCTR